MLRILALCIVDPELNFLVCLWNRAGLKGGSMRKLIHALFVMACLSLVGCGAASVQALKDSPGYHKAVVSKHGYQESLKIVKDSYVELLGVDLSCTTYPDMKTGECSITGTYGITFFVSTKYLDDNSSTVDFYNVLDTSLVRDKIAIISSRLTK